MPVLRADVRSPVRTNHSLSWATIKRSMSFDERMERLNEAFGQSMKQLDESLTKLKRLQDRDVQPIRRLAVKAEAMMESIKRANGAGESSGASETNSPETRLP